MSPTSKPRRIAFLIFLAFTAAAQTPPGTLATIYSFPGDGAGQPAVGVILGSGNVLYGSDFISNLYSLTPPVTGHTWTYATIYTFPGGTPGVGVEPNALAIDSQGVLYGTTFFGGIDTGTCADGGTGCGFVFSLIPPPAPGGAWTEKTLYEFTGLADGARPQAGVLIGPNGVLYGTTSRGGTTALGTVFSLTPPASPGATWSEQTLYTFVGGADGEGPRAALAMDSNGTIYGNTPYGGGTENGGVAFSLAPPASPGGAWTETVIYTFATPSGGLEPNGGVLIGAGASGETVLYGCTRLGGADAGGVAYSLTAPASPGGAWTQAVLHIFGPGTVGVPSPGPLSWGTGGVMYGMTSAGGAMGLGTIFALKPPAASPGPWTYAPLYTFAAPGPHSPILGEILAVDPSGLIFGTAYAGGAENLGAVFSVRP